MIGNAGNVAAVYIVNPYATLCGTTMNESRVFYKNDAHRQPAARLVYGGHSKCVLLLEVFGELS